MPHSERSQLFPEILCINVKLLDHLHYYHLMKDQGRDHTQNGPPLWISYAHKYDTLSGSKSKLKQEEAM